ncbi:6-pyruvoyl-tetrahydropterin synthase-related protein [Acidobacteria bacterium AH-259-D05]|nr:6-pyruvoyl-tetrahydropterin synthase-related protein [Acidobacteria bacterium AH-259-D05]
MPSNVFLKDLPESKKIRSGINLLLLLLILLFLLSYFEPHLLFTDTTPAGGDTPSHFTAAHHFRDIFFNHGQVTGWDYGNLAGYPLFQYYFPLPFILCALFSLILPLSVSFKIVTVMGTFLLPLSTFYFLKRLDFQFPIPIIGSSSVLLFLFVESQSMWGGNIASTLAGEFTYSLGMALALFYLGSVYRDIGSGRGIWKNSFLLALTGFSHGCALLVAAITPLYCLFQGARTFDRLKYYLKVNLLAFMFLAFWLVPWLLSQEYTTEFNFRWVFHSWSELFPAILLPLYALAAISGLYSLYHLVRSKNEQGIEVQKNLVYLWFGALVCVVFFYIGHQLNVVDIRFIPFLQLFVVLIGGVFLGTVVQRVPVNWSFTIAIVLLAVVWTDYNSETNRAWIKWNNEGFEKKPRWPVLDEVRGFLEGTFEDPRVVYEHSPLHDQFGSVRTFESLPYFSGRATLEGAYLQSSVNSPFIFYLQSEVSKVSSCPLPDYHCSSLDLRRALPHLELFNVSNLILRSDSAKQQARRLPEFVLEKSVAPLEIYRISDDNAHYVVPLSCKPVLYSGEDWKRWSFQWFRNYHSNSVPVVMDQNPAPQDRSGFARETEVFPVVETCSPQSGDCRVEEIIEHDRILVRTSCIGHPLLVKMSYHPRWKVKGASKVYLAAPGFMIVFPQQTEVELRFGWGASEYLGATVTSLSILWGIFGLLWGGLISGETTGVSKLRWNPSLIYMPPAIERFLQWLRSRAGATVLKVLIAAAAVSLVAYLLLGVESTKANTLFEKGFEHYENRDLERAIEYFQKAAQLSPESSFGVNGRFYWGLSLYRLERYNEAAQALRVFVNQFPESVHAPEATYHVGLCHENLGQTQLAKKYFEEVLTSFPDTRWSNFARTRLNSLNDN